MNIKEAYKRGQDYAKNGANTYNRNPMIFRSEKTKKAWKEGKESIKKKTKKMKEDDR